MTSVAETILNFFRSYTSDAVESWEQLPRSGGDRIYFRVKTAAQSYIITYNENIKENETFLNFTKHLKVIDCPVPHIYFIHPDGKMYIQEDFGKASLLNELEARGEHEYVFNLFKKSLKNLARLQIKGDEVIDYKVCLTSKEFGKQAILSDLLYFKYYFLDTLKIPYDKEQLIEDFDVLSQYLTHVPYKYFMFRDFQSRNICVENDEVHFIDYQGGMKGALQYDVASLLWQARAQLSEEWKNSLLEYYMDCVEEILGKKIDRNQFVNQYNGYVLIRIMQVLGAYGFRGLFERKSQFLTSIPLTLTNLKWFLANKNMGISLTEFERLLNLIVTPEIINRFNPVQATSETPLLITINSFSFLKRGYPASQNNHGGGFVFDCRGIHNPGRLPEFKTLTGRDKPVMDFLEQQTKMPDFLNGVYNILDISVEDYIKRSFDTLSINFGCTGGQHRSVYAADATARYLRNKYKVKIQINHLEQNFQESRGL